MLPQNTQTNSRENAITEYVQAVFQCIPWLIFMNPLISANCTLRSWGIGKPVY